MWGIGCHTPLPRLSLIFILVDIVGVALPGAQVAAHGAGALHHWGSEKGPGMVALLLRLSENSEFVLWTEAPIN